MASDGLTRSETDRKIGGVCGGLAAHFGIDATLVRVGFVIAALMGWGILAYVVLWIVLPTGAPITPAVRIAEERYARGEIGADDLARIRGDLRSRA